MGLLKTRYKWIILFMVYICMLTFAFSLQFLPPLLPLIIVDFRLSHTQAGFLMSLFTLPSIFLAVAAGLLSDRWGSYKVGFISLLTVIAGTLTFALSRTFAVAGVGRIVSGTGAVMLTIVAAKILSQWFQDSGVGSAMGLYNTAMPVGSIICFSLFGNLAAGTGWRLPVYITVGIGFLGLAAFVFLFRSAPHPAKKETYPRPEEKKTLPHVLHTARLVWMAALCWLLFNAAVISFSTFAPDFFISRGLAIGQAGALTSLLMWGSLILSPVIGRLIDKFNSNALFIGMGGILLGIALIFVPKCTSFLPPMAVMAVAVACVPTPVFSYLSKNLPSQDLGLGFGILGMVSGIGMFIGPLLSGLFRDKTGSYETAFLFLAALSFLMTAAAILFQLKSKKTHP